MQNIDFYEGKSIRSIPPQYERTDPEFYARMTDIHPREEEKHRKKANRMMFVIISLCIISFTAGLVIGIKFAGGSDRKIVDDRTLTAVTGIGEKMTGLMAGEKEKSKSVAQQGERQKDSVFPKEEYPFLIKIGAEYDKGDSQKIANYLSSKGHTVILSKSGKDNYKIYIGPYKNQLDAKASLIKFSEYSEFSIASNSRIVKRI